MIENKFEFTTECGAILFFVRNKSNIEIQVSTAEQLGDDFGKVFREKLSHDFVSSLTEWFKISSEKIWSNFEPKCADSIGSDYDEYYDKQYDTNGSVSLQFDKLNIAPSVCDLPIFEIPRENVRIYRFNKAKAQSFLFDLEKILN